jgi:hypothetical protein
VSMSSESINALGHPKLANPTVGAFLTGVSIMLVQLFVVV